MCTKISVAVASHNMFVRQCASAPAVYIYHRVYSHEHSLLSSSQHTVRAGKASPAEMAISRRALIMGCNGVLGRSMVQHIRALDGWHVMGADVSSTPAIDGLDMINLDPGSGAWADNISAMVEELPEMDLVVTESLLTSHMGEHMSWAGECCRRLGRWRRVIH